MISRQDLERLAAVKSEHGILTAYIRLDPRLRFVRQQATLQFKGALKAAQRRVEDSRWRDALERESARVLDSLANQEPAGRGLVIFSCAPDSLWEVFQLDAVPPNLVDIDSTTKTGLLASLLQELPRLILAVVQRDRAQLYIGVQGTSDEQGQIKSNVPGQHKQGGRSQMRFERHIEFHVSEHLKKVADELEALAKRFSFDLVLGGTDQIVSEMEQTLPEPIARKVIGHFAVDYKHETEQEILERAERVWNEREQRQENDLVDQVVAAAKSAGPGVLGVGPTLDALVQEKVRILLISSGLTIDGSVCPRCDYLAAERFDKCPFCGAGAEQRELTDRAVEKALTTSAEVEVVTGDGARDRLLAEGGLGALLRY